MFQHLDDAWPLPACSREQRAAVLARGEHLRRRRRAVLVGLPVAGVAVVVSAVVALTVVPGPAGDSTLTSAAPPPPPLVLDGEITRTGPAYGACPDPAGDSAGEPDVTLFSLDRPAVPFVHFSWDRDPLRVGGVVELRFEATSADGLRSRQLVGRTTADGEVLEQFVRDPRTGARRDVVRTMEGPGDGGVAASFPAGSLSGLGDRWTWVASLSVDGAVVDTCDPARSRRELSPPADAGG